MQAFGHKTGSGAPASAQDIALDRKERLRRLAIETVDLSKDPYLHRNHVGKIECRLCLTLHLNEASYLTHTQGRKHQTNLARRAAKEQSFGTMPQPGGGGGGGGGGGVAPPTLLQPPTTATPPTPSFGRPGYRVTKLRDPITKQIGLRIEVEYHQSGGGGGGTTSGGITSGGGGGGTTSGGGGGGDHESGSPPSPLPAPCYKFVKSWEQKVEAVDNEWQYVVFASKCYDTIGFKIQSSFDIDSKNLLSFWDPANKIYLLQFLFKKQEGGE